ncbi:hypothetical protein BH23BAC3_BH23BAC3_27750 [soil metagenome]
MIIPADLLLRNSEEKLSNLSAGTLDKFEEVFIKINQVMDI